MRPPSDVEQSRLAALADAIQTGTGPVVSLSWAPVDALPGAAVQFTADATQEQRDAVTQTVQGWDWSEAAANADKRARAKTQAKDAFASVDNPARIAARNADRALFRSLVQTRQKLNEVIAWINANGGSITPLVNRSFAQAMQGAQALVDAETDPTGD